MQTDKERQGEVNRSKQKEGKASLDSKKGVFTSRYQVEDKPHAKVYLQSSLGNSIGQGFHTHLLPSFQESKVVEAQKINVGEKKNQTFIKSKQYISVPQRENYHMSHHHQSAKVSQPGVNFSYVNQHQGQSRSPSPIRYVPIANHHTVIPTQEQVQVRRTLVPNKIYNYIPVGSSMAQSHNVAHHSDQAYEVLLKEYEKLYEKFHEEEQHSHEMAEIIEKMKRNPPQKEVIRERGKISLNLQLMHDKLYQYYQEYMNRILGMHKQRCHERIGKLFEEASKQVIVTEEVSTSQWIS